MGMQQHPTSPVNRAAFNRHATPVDWMISDGLVAYPDAIAFMDERVAQIAGGEARELIWLLEHPPLYTAGTSAKLVDLVSPNRFPVFEAGRGGQYTYHGPGQRVAYVMLDVRKRSGDVRKFVNDLEGWLIDTLATFNVRGETRGDRVGVWVQRPNAALAGRASSEGSSSREDKIGAIGIRLRRWISFHGVSLNVEPDLEHFGGIVPCGIREHGVTSLVDLGLPVTISDVDVALKMTFEQRFGALDPI